VIVESVVTDILVGAIAVNRALSVFGPARAARIRARRVFPARPAAAHEGAGADLSAPVLARMQKVSLRVMAIDVPPQDVITRDNISIKVNAVLYMRVKTPDKPSWR